MGILTLLEHYHRHRWILSRSDVDIQGHDPDQSVQVDRVTGVLAGKQAFGSKDQPDEEHEVG